MKKIIFSFFLSLLLAGCGGNIFKTFYEEFPPPEGSYKLCNNEEPNVIKYNKPLTLDDIIDLECQGYVVLGESAFAGAGYARIENATSFGKEIGACKIIITEQRAGNAEVMSPIISDTRTKFGSASSLTLYNKTVDRNEYHAYYFAKMNMNNKGFGFFLKEFTDEMKQKYETNKGLFINGIIKDSPAYEADLLKGDILISIEGVKIISQDSISEAKQKSKGKSIVKFVIKRNDKIIEKELHMK